MARSRFETWTCDRCGATATSPIPSDRDWSEMPQGWGNPVANVAPHLCPECLASYRAWMAGGGGSAVTDAPVYCEVCPHAMFLHNEDGSCGCGIDCAAGKEPTA